MKTNKHLSIPSTKGVNWDNEIKATLDLQFMLNAQTNSQHSPAESGQQNVKWAVILRMLKFSKCNFFSE